MSKQKATTRADGLLVKTVKDPRTGKRVYFYGRTEREVNKKMLLFTESASIGRTFAEVADEWWSDALERIAHNTRGGYKPALQRAVAEFGDKPIKEIKPRDVQRFLTSLKHKFSAKTLITQRLIINLIMDVAVMDGDIDVNPCTSVRLPKSERHIRPAASVSEEDIIKANADLWLFPFFALMTGMRKGELIALQWRDIDFKEDRIHVNKSVYHISNVPLIKQPKTAAGCRVVPLLKPLKEKLLGMPQSEREPDGYIFSVDGGKTPLTHTRFEALYKAYRKQTGLSSTPHQLRHSFATIAFECGVPIKSVQEILGHRQISTTMDIYTDFRKKSVEDAAKILNEKMG
jgi:integrase